MWQFSSRCCVSAVARTAYYRCCTPASRAAHDFSSDIPKPRGCVLHVAARESAKRPGCSIELPTRASTCPGVPGCASFADRGRHPARYHESGSAESRVNSRIATTSALRLCVCAFDCGRPSACGVVLKHRDGNQVRLATRSSPTPLYFTRGVIYCTLGRLGAPATGAV